MSEKMQKVNKRILIEYALSMLHVPYIYGGNSVMTGLDCSGLCCEILKSVGVMRNNEDRNAQGIYELLTENANYREAREDCAFAFYGRSRDKIVHVAFHVDEFLVVEAAGGGSDVLSLEEARKRDARVRIRRYNYRQDYLASISIF